jgi:hypothetical protein
MQSDVQQQGADHTALRSSLLSRREPAAIDHARLQPTADQFPGGELPESRHEVFVVDAVKCRRQVRVQDP